jgi:serine/threonine-protein kinase RsbW
MRNFVEAATRHCGLSEDDVFAFKLAGDEACANIIQHGFEEHEPGFISLAFEAEPQKARLIIRDDGTHFPPDQAESPDLEAECMERRIGGLGIYLIKQLMNNVFYNKTESNLNTLVLEKDLTIIV